MVRRSHNRRKRFPCHHLGFGKYCHRCIQPTHSELPVIAIDVTVSRSKKSAAQIAAKRQAKRQWQQSFATDPIDLTHLPKPIVLKTRQILESLNQGASPSDWKGKRFNFDRTLLRIPISYRYRLLCRWQSGRIIPMQVLTHEAYNAIARNKKQVQ